VPAAAAGMAAQGPLVTFAEMRTSYGAYCALPDDEKRAYLQASGKNSLYFHTQKGMKQTHKGMKKHCFSRKHVFHTLKRHFIPV
jgi:hypothetical protein